MAPAVKPTTISKTVPIEVMVPKITPLFFGKINTELASLSLQLEVVALVRLLHAHVNLT